MMLDRLKYTLKSILTLSAAPVLLPEDAQAAAYIERELRAIHRSRQRGGHWRWRLDLLFDFVLKDEPQLTVEDRALFDMTDGNR